MKKIFSLMALLMALGLTSARAELSFKQVGEVAQSNTTIPYTMSKYTETISVYPADVIGLPEGTSIQEINYLGYWTESRTNTYKFTLYVTNTDLTTINKTNNPFMTAGAYGQIVDTSKFEKFGEYTVVNTTAGGSQANPQTVLTFTNENGFNYEGGNIATFLYVEYVEGSGTNYTTFCQFTNFNALSMYRESGYTEDTSGGGYGLSTKSFSDGYKYAPVLDLGFGAAGGSGNLEHITIGQAATTQPPSFYYPLNTSEKFAQGILIYNKATLGLNPNTSIKEVSFLGYEQFTKTGVNKFTLYLANTTETTVNSFITNKQAFDYSQLTYFGEYNITNPTPTGSKTDPVDIITFSNNSGFNYTGDNLVVFVELATESGTYPQFTFIMASAPVCVGAQRTAAYTDEQYGGGYGLASKDWSINSDNAVKMPVMNIGYGGEKVVVSATINGKVVSSRNNSAVTGATVSFTDCEDVVTTSNGKFSFTVEDVDRDKTYSISVTAEGFEPYSQEINIKAGGTIELSDIVLIRLDVPATIKGTVKNSVTNAGVAGVTVSFNGTTVTSGTEGNYSIAVANIEALTETTLSASAKGYLPYSTNLTNLVGGENTININIVPIPELPGGGTQIGQFNDINDYSYFSPINPLSTYAASETVYPASMFAGVETGTKFSSVSFFGYYNKAVATPDPDEGDDDYNSGWYAKGKADEAVYREYNIKAYMVNVDQATIDANTAIDYSTYTPLYEGTVQWPMGGSKQTPDLTFAIPFETPFTYEGGNVAVIIQSVCTLKPTDADGGTVPLFCVDPSAPNNVIYKSENNENAFLQAKWSVPNAYSNPNGVPVMKLGEYVPTGKISGKVTDKATGQPLEGVEVTLEATGLESVNGTTDAEGFYSLSLRQVDYDTQYTLSFSYGDYYDESQGVTFTDETLEQTINVQMEKPAQSLTGTIIGSVTTVESSPIEGVTVTLSKQAEGSESVEGNIASTTTSYDGNFTIVVTDLDLTSTYTLSFSKTGYEPSSIEAEFEIDAMTGKYTAYVYVDLVEDTEDGVSVISADFNGAIYTLTGICIKKNATIDDVKALPQGIYVIGGKKVVM